MTAAKTYEVTCSECGAHWIFACGRCAGRVFEDSEAAAQRAAADHEAFHKEDMS